MNRHPLGLLAAAAIVSTFVAVGATLIVLHLASPQPVQAAPDKKELRIAIVNLERVSRETPKFKALQRDWNEAQLELKKWNEKMSRDYKATVAEFQRASAEGLDEDYILRLRVEAQALEQALKAAKNEQQEYLAALLAEYQEIVLEDVVQNLKRYVRQEGYNIVFQDYDDPSGDADYFSGAAYAQSIMSKPVVDAPWALEGDPHVTDITEVMIRHMSAGGVPEKRKD